MARDIFISYSQPDRDCANGLTRHLEASGFSVWIAPRDVSPAAEWAAEIIDAIADAKVMVLVFSASSNSSPQVRREVERAVHKDVRILPFRIEDVLPSRSLEYFLSAQHWLDGFPQPHESHFERLSACLRQWIPAAAGSNAEVIHGYRVSVEQRRQLETRLARILGPIAGILIDRMAVGATDCAELERRLAAELDSDDRQRFLEARQ